MNNNERLPESPHGSMNWLPNTKLNVTYKTTQIRKKERKEKDDCSNDNNNNKKLSYCWETVRRESMPRIAEMDVEMTTKDEMTFKCT